MQLHWSFNLTGWVVAVSLHLLSTVQQPVFFQQLHSGREMEWIWLAVELTRLQQSLGTGRQLNLTIIYASTNHLSWLKVYTDAFQSAQWMDLFKIAT
jgi:hypothetical protein